jgi:tetratricopeptide (TPR) repeat protein
MTRLRGIKRKQKALADYSKAIELNPENVNAYFYTDRGQVYLELFEDEKALADFSKALKLKKRLCKLYLARLCVL